MLGVLLFAALSFGWDMSEKQLVETGVHRLTDEEKIHLQKWVAKHFQALEKKKKKPELSENLFRGKYIKLTDDTLWEIHPKDRPITQGWISAVAIEVEEKKEGEYPYLLINSLSLSKVRAQKTESIEE